ncbi:MAG: epoxyqueuosine reductase QueH [Clostridiales bacterium]|nr:epoxyqueuosine reductase QueH [Clostridiales bacterium]
MKKSDSLLVHACCAPCLIYINKYFKTRDISYDSLYYNPNIHPYKEYVRRFKTLQSFCDEEQVKLHHFESFRQKDWENKPNNCDFCYNLRIETVAKFAKENNYTHFTTTLLISPYQQHEKIIKIANEMANKYNVKFLYIDFRPFYREGQNMARDHGMYRQKYCGCINSFNSSKFKDKITFETK